MDTTIGQYLAKRLAEIGLKEYFVIPGDYNLVLLDELLQNDTIKMISCCNELNAGYAADGYARGKGAAALVITYSVGGLSAINAVAGAYAENLPVIIISGSPNTNSLKDNELLHHTLGKLDYAYVREMFEKVTVRSVTINVHNAAYQIDSVIETALTNRKPVYIEIPCNIAKVNISLPTRRDLRIHRQSDDTALADAVNATQELLNNAVKPVIVAGSHIRAWGCGPLVEQLAKKTDYALAAMPDAKGFISEQQQQYIGIYWGPVSTPGCAEIIESSDCYLFIGPQFTDYTTTGHTTHILLEKLIQVNSDHVNVAGDIYTRVFMKDFLSSLMEVLQPNNHSLETYRRIAGEAPLPQDPADINQPITTRYLFSQIQKMLDSNTAIIAETGDSWFNGVRLKLPQDCLYEFQMQYGSIGWSVGALFGYQLALANKKRVIALIGDGSFQMGAQEVSTMIRYGVNPILFLMNNGSYTIEVQIHDGPYNLLKNWNYAGLVDVFNDHDGTGWSTQVKTCAELKESIKKALKKNSLCFIEVFLDPNDCNKSLLEWGSRVSSLNNRP